MSIAPDSVSYPVLAVIQAHGLSNEEAARAYEVGAQCRRWLEAGRDDAFVTMGWDRPWAILVAYNMVRSYRHFNP